MKLADQTLQHFNTLIAQLDGGALNEDLTQGFRTCVDKVSELCMDRGGKHKASITLTLTVEMDQKDRVIEINASVNEKLPKAPRGRAGLFFLDQDGNLTRENPRQYTLEDEVERQRRIRSGEAQ